MIALDVAASEMYKVLWIYITFTIMKEEHSLPTEL